MSHDKRYLLGVDLGTTNCALAYVDALQMSEDPVAIESFAIPQLVKAGEMGSEPLLPSFLYLPAAGETAMEKLQTPWASDRNFAVGKFARDQGAAVPTRLVSSAKSWLCHEGIDRRGAILPWTAEPEFAKISPVEASVRLLEHLRDAWNYERGPKDKAGRLEDQDIVLTVPASFDAVARELTAEAARLAGFTSVTLFEEPQAAFYAWIHHAGADWRKQVRPGDVVLVIDVGGGTTDLSLIGVGEEKGDLALNRLAVGEHLLLGGDNMDLTLAHVVARSIANKVPKLDANQMLGLWHACRVGKEQLFQDAKKKTHPIAVLGRGSKVIGGSIRADLGRDQVESVLVDGFFPKISFGEEPAVARGVGLQELGLAYAADPAITKHISAFLGRHADHIREYRQSKDKSPALPTAVLFNGGVFQAEPLRARVLETLAAWTGKPIGEAIRELPAVDLDRAVAQGAAYYARVRRGHGIRIRGGVGRSYYIGVETSMPAVPGAPAPIKALCVVPQGMEEGSEVALAGREFGLLVNKPAEFRFLGSTQRRGDVVGTLVDDWEESITEVAPIRATLEADVPAGHAIPVQLHAKVTEVGVLELWFESRAGQRWKLEFNVREPS